MARYISFAVLLGIIVVIGALFYKVMIGFFVPVFLAAVLVVVFRPLHRWVGSKVGERDHIAAGITTTLILLIVLIPASLVLTMAAIQGAGFVKDFNFSSIQYGLAKLRTNDWVNLEYPHAPIVREIQSKVEDIQKEATEQRLEELLNPKGKLQGDIKEIRKRLPDLIPSLTKQSIVEMERKFNSNRKKKNAELVVRSDLEKILEQANEQLKEVFADVLPPNEAVEMETTDRETSVWRMQNSNLSLVCYQVYLVLRTRKPSWKKPKKLAILFWIRLLAGETPSRISTEPSTSCNRVNPTNLKMLLSFRKLCFC